MVVSSFDIHIFISFLNPIMSFILPIFRGDNIHVVTTLIKLFTCAVSIETLLPPWKFPIRKAISAVLIWISPAPHLNHCITIGVYSRKRIISGASLFDFQKNGVGIRLRKRRRIKSGNTQNKSEQSIHSRAVYNTYLFFEIGVAYNR